MSIGILAFNIPYIYSLRTKLTFVITVPWDIDVVAFEDQHSKPVEDLQLVVDAPSPCIGGKKNWSISVPPVGRSVRSIGPSLLGVKTVENLTSPAGSTVTPGDSTYLSVQPLFE